MIPTSSLGSLRRRDGRHHVSASLLRNPLSGADDSPRCITMTIIYKEAGSICVFCKLLIEMDNELMMTRRWLARVARHIHIDSAKPLSHTLCVRSVNLLSASREGTSFFLFLFFVSFFVCVFSSIHALGNTWLLFLFLIIPFSSKLLLSLLPPI